MLPFPEIILLDDEVEYLRPIVEGLNKLGTTCLPIHFTSETSIEELKFEKFRVLISDLHLLGSGGGTDERQHFSIIASILKKAVSKNNGPFILILWTNFPNESDECTKYLNNSSLPTNCLPMVTLALGKEKFFDGNKNLIDPEGLKNEIVNTIEKQPQFAALLNWEQRVGRAAGLTLSIIMGMISKENFNENGLQSELDNLLSVLAVEAVGKDNVGKDKLASVNKALHPILFDQINSINSSRNEQKTWKLAVTKYSSKFNFDESKAAFLNSKFHISDSAEKLKSTDRGVVISLPTSWKEKKRFKNIFGLKKESVGLSEFAIPEFDQKNFRKVHWIMAQVQAACDHAQRQPGPLPFILGMEVPSDVEFNMGKKKGSLWISPIIKKNEKKIRLAFNNRFILNLTRDQVKKYVPIYRLREEFLNEIIFQLHIYCARPGYVSFRKYD